MGGSVTALARSVVPWHPATAWALFASTIILVTAGRSHGFESGLRGAVVAFIAWAIVRELAPARVVPALLVPFAAIAFSIPTHADLAAAAATLLAARIAARSTGAPPTYLDTLVLLLVAGWCAMRPGALPAALVLSACVAADAPPHRMRITGIVMLAVVLVIGSIEGTLTMRPDWTGLPTQGVILLIVAAVATAWAILAPLPGLLVVRDDRDAGQLRGARVRAARVATLACVVAAVGWAGTDGVFVAASASAALLAAGLGGARQRSAGPPSPTGAHGMPATAR